MCVNGKFSPTKKFTCVTNYIVFVKQKKIGKTINKGYYGKNEIVTHVNIFVGGTFPFPQGIFMQS